MSITYPKLISSCGWCLRKRHLKLWVLLSVNSRGCGWEIGLLYFGLFLQNSAQKFDQHFNMTWKLKVDACKCSVWFCIRLFQGCWYSLQPYIFIHSGILCTTQYLMISIIIYFFQVIFESPLYFFRLFLSLPYIDDIDKYVVSIIISFKKALTTSPNG